MPAHLTAAPLVFEPLLEPRIWGGRGLERYGKRLPAGTRIGESWEISAVAGKATRVVAGPHDGDSLEDLVARYPEDVLGRLARTRGGEATPCFPLLFKLLEASENLSVQVHPSDADLRALGETGLGKTEAWIILDAEPGARIVTGAGPGVDPRELLRRLQLAAGGKLQTQEEERLFRWVSVRRGDVIYVPAGTVHAVGRGIVLLEVQQTSDITYRLYDWGRTGDDGKPRELHLGRAAAVARWDEERCPYARLGEVPPTVGWVPLLRCAHFAIELLQLGGGSPGCGPHSASTLTGADSGEPHVLAAFEGRAELKTPGGGAVALEAGQFVLLPSALGGYRLSASKPAQVLRFLAGG